MGDFRKLLREKMALLKLDESFAARYVNEGFCGGEKKRLEMLQMAVLQPKMAILDETDSGLDIDALRIVAEGVNAQLNPDLGVLLITHYQRILNYINPDVVHVLAKGQIVASGGRDLALRLEEEGYAPILREAGLELDVEDERETARAGGSRNGPLTGRGKEHSQPWPSSGRSTRLRYARTSTIFEREFRGRRSWRISTAPRPASSRASWPRRCRGYLNRYSANVHRGIYEIGEEATAAYEGARADDRQLHRRHGRARNHHGPQRDRGDQPRRLRVGPQEHRPCRHDRHDGDGAPLQPDPVADARPGEGRRPRVRALRRGRPAHPGQLRRPAPNQAQARRVHRGEQRHRHDQSRSRTWSRAPTRPARSCSSTRAQAVPHEPVNVQDMGLRLPRLLAATRRSARQAPARSGRGARSSRRCRRSWAAAR